MLKTFFLILIIGLPLSAAARTLTFKQARYAVTLSHSPHAQDLGIKGTILSSKGEYDQSLLHFLGTWVRAGLDIKLNLDVFGGDLALVNKVYDVLKGKCDGKSSRPCQIETEVDMFRYCASACIPLFMVGDIRRAAERSNWGFHQAATLGGYLMIPFMAEYVLRGKGVHPQWLEDNKKIFRSLKMTWMRPHDLHGSNILTHIEAHPD